ncbi:multidrug effflux MFS transporter [Mucilaginibacter sp. UR6-11]|uniref:multidrug effflux MFS transporter n=1 Tax=Mucilaginibacter sp. UR6-11 TaxID=1435644 RepID=UPI001E604282|nr:multidrug effflux MFS transporter [Mucilaginibacter sp. UR6-11]MCC8425659.1 multidrug effflux MFS transporter [Mucilaginibacter sp. UR6-11]
MTKKRYFLTVLILGSLTALGPFSIDMYLPGFPAIAKSLHTTTAQVSLSLSSFFIGLAAGQLLYGPLLDRFGRKKPLYVGLVLYIIASAGCFFSTGIETLILLRFIQAIGSCAAGVASMAMVRDIFPLKDNAKIFALLILILGASPMLAPTIGGYVTVVWGWHEIFVILGIMALLILLAVILFLPESYKADPTYSLKPAPIINSFLQVIKEPQFYTYAFAGAFAFCGLFVYVSASPIVFMEVFKVSAKVYGWIFATLSVGFIGSSQVNNLLLKKYKSEQIIWVSMGVQVVTALLFFIGSWYNWYGLYSTIGMIFILLCCVGTTSPNASALSLAPFEKNAGTASALLGALQLGLGALATLGISMFNSHSAVPMAAIMESTAIIGLLILLTGRRRIKNKVDVSGAGAVMAH